MRSLKAWVRGRSFAGIAGTNPTDSIYVRVFWVSGVVRIENNKYVVYIAFLHFERNIKLSEVSDCSLLLRYVRPGWSMYSIAWYIKLPMSLYVVYYPYYILKTVIKIL
jgi:hypothetical protein